MDEFALIELIETTLNAPRGAMGGIGDDAAILEIPEGEQLVVSTDTLVEGVHFRADAVPEDIGYKSLAVNLSDLAAMGARPGWFFLSLTLPSLDARWVKAFADGLKEAAQSAGIALAGGDTTRGPLSITITVCGLIHPGECLLRSGARAGDVIGISGATGLASLALQEREHERELAPAVRAALDRPIARLELGRALLGLASSCIDVSDGLLADLGHISDASGVGMKVWLQDLPCPPELAELPEKDRLDLQLGGGDDYELCFTAPQKHWDKIEKRANKLGIPVTRIGEVVEEKGCLCLLPNGQPFEPARAGYNHGS